MTVQGDRYRRIASLVIFAVSLVLAVLVGLGTSSSDLLFDPPPFASSSLFGLVGFALIELQRKGSVGGVGGTKNSVIFFLPVLIGAFFYILTATVPTPLLPSSGNTTTSLPSDDDYDATPSLLPLPSPPSSPSASCFFHLANSASKFPLPANSTSPPASYLDSTVLKQSTCSASMTDADGDLIISAFQLLDTAALLQGVGPDDWDAEECKRLLNVATTRAFSPACSADCEPLGFCDEDCDRVIEACGKIASYDILQMVMEGGSFYHGLVGLVGERIAPCISDLFTYVSGGGNASKICTSAVQPASLAYVATGANPGQDCFPLATDLDVFLRDPAAEGQCALKNWAEYAAEVAAVEAYNARNDTSDQSSAAAGGTNGAAEPPVPAFPWWRKIALPGLVLATFLLSWAGGLAAAKKLTKGGNPSAVTPELNASDSTVSAFHANLPRVADTHSFVGFFGISGVFIAVAMLAIGSLAVYLGLLAEKNDAHSSEVCCLHCIALMSLKYAVDSSIFWRVEVHDLESIARGELDALSSLDNFPHIKKMMMFYNDYFAVPTNGKYSILIVVGSELLEFLVQSHTASTVFAAFLSWELLRPYANLICANWIIFGLSNLAPSRYISASTIITIDVIIDALYVLFNITLLDKPASYWPIIFPLALSVEMLHDSLIREAHENVSFYTRKLVAEHKFDVAKANGTFAEDLCTSVLNLIDSGRQHFRMEVSTPRGFDELNPHVYVQDSDTCEVVTMISQFTVPDVTPGQVFTFLHRYTAEERGAGENRILEVISPRHQCMHGLPKVGSAASLVKPRDVVIDNAWCKLTRADGSVMFVEGMKSCRRDDCPPTPECVRADSNAGLVVEAAPSGGTLVTYVALSDAKGRLPTSLVNHAVKGGMVARIKAYYAYFIERKGIDGKDNGGDWPDHESVYAFKIEGKEGFADDIEQDASDARGEKENALKAEALEKLQLVANRSRELNTRINPTVYMRRYLGYVFLFFGVGLYAFIATTVARQQRLCETEFGTCAWEKMEHKLYFKNGVFAGAVCGIGVDEHPSEKTWDLDFSGCTDGALGLTDPREEFDRLAEVGLRGVGLVALPGWLEEAMTNGASRPLRVVDVGDNNITHMPYAVMNATAPELALAFDNNPCSEYVDWSGLGVDVLPVRMTAEAGYDNGNWSITLKRMRLAGNRFDESIFGTVAAAGYDKMEELDLSGNDLGRLHEEDTGNLAALRWLNVSGNYKIEDIENAPGNLEMLDASHCGITSISKEKALELSQSSNLLLTGNNVTEVNWKYLIQMRSIPTWVRTLDSLKKVGLDYSGVNETIKAGDFPPTVSELELATQMGGLNMHNGAFSGLPDLQYLDVSNNFLEEEDMHAGLFAGNSELWHLSMDGNVGIRKFDAPSLFPGDSGANLVFLRLENCGLNLRTVGGGGGGTSFEGLNGLRLLFLQDNGMTEIGERAFSNLHQLEVLRLDNYDPNADDNVFDSLPAGLFRNLTSLRYIRLSLNQTASPRGREFEGGVFEGLDCAAFCGSKIVSAAAYQSRNLEVTSWNETECERQWEGTDMGLLRHMCLEQNANR
jgi:Leucine-rich repeat (LRR) protein